MVITHPDRSIGMTLHEQIKMNVNTLDPHFDAMSCRNDSLELDWAFERTRSPDGI